ncbi:MAG: NADH:ubiquinone reductase (Na(+)-transporting) subunit C [Mucinivorans sp.]
MNKNSNTYTILYATVMVVLVAAILSFAAIVLKPAQQANVRIEKMEAILGSIGQGQDAAKASNKSKYIEEQYKKYITSEFMVSPDGEKVDGDAFSALSKLPEVFAQKKAFPVFEAKLDDGKMLYVIPMSGKGLWGPVWGYMALNADCNTIFGAKFDHKGETPGLGAEIATPIFSNQFVGKNIFQEDKFMSVDLTKGVGSSDGNPYAVDAISGGTLTSNGVKAMINTCLGSYVPFFDKVRAAQVQSEQAMVADSTVVNS